MLNRLALIMFSIISALLFIMICLLVLGYNPLLFFTQGLGPAITTSRGIIGALSLATPILFTGLGWIVGKKAGIANLGLEGAVYMSALAALASGGLLELRIGFHQLVVWLCAAAAGAVWLLIPAFFKYIIGVHEVITTLMFNWAALYLAGFVIIKFLRDPAWPMFSVQILPSARLYPLFGTGSATIMLIVGIVVCVGVQIFLWQTRLGLRMRATGWNEFTARTLGVPTSYLQFLSFLIGGLLGGCAAFSLTAGMPPYWRITDTADLLIGHGFNGIAAASLALDNALGVLPGAIFLGIIVSGMRFAQIYVRIPPEIANIMTGIILIIIALPEIVDSIVRPVLKKREVLYAKES